MRGLNKEEIEVLHLAEMECYESEEEGSPYDIYQLEVRQKLVDEGRAIWLDCPHCPGDEHLHITSQGIEALSIMEYLDCQSLV